MVLKMRRKVQGNDMLMVTDRKGRITFVTSPFAAMLGYGPKAMRGMDISALMQQPFSQLHQTLIKVRLDARRRRLAPFPTAAGCACMWRGCLTKRWSKPHRRLLPCASPLPGIHSILEAACTSADVS